MKKIKERFIGEREFEWPMILKISEFEEAEEERKILEDLISSVDPSIQRNWLNRIITPNDSTFLGAWFEMMLYGWLKNFTSPKIEPEFEKDLPDFQININGKEIIIEAVVRRYTNEEIKKNKNEAAVWWAVHQVNVPYAVSYDASKIVAMPETDHLIEDLNVWLKSTDQEIFKYNDDQGNNITFKPFHRNLYAVSSNNFSSADTKPIESTLWRKSNQHVRLRKKGFPYIIAIYLESHTLKANDVIKAWLGSEKYIYEKDFTKFIGAIYDGTGISFNKNGELRHGDVSGILIFKQKYFDQPMNTLIKGWYFDNPFCNPEIHVDGSLFPVEDCFIVAKRYEDRVTMNWKKKSDS